MLGIAIVIIAVIVCHLILHTRIRHLEANLERFDRELYKRFDRLEGTVNDIHRVVAE